MGRSEPSDNNLTMSTTFRGIRRGIIGDHRQAIQERHVDRQSEKVEPSNTAVGMMSKKGIQQTMGNPSRF